MTESDLLANDDFLAFCERWEADQHCPFPLIDWLLDRGEETMAEAARWAVEKEERHRSRTRPSKNNLTDRLPYYWVSLLVVGNLEYYVPISNNGSYKGFQTFPAAIAYYFTHFDQVLAAEYPPKRKAAHV